MKSRDKSKSWTKGGKLIQSTCGAGKDLNRHDRGNAHQGTRARLPLFSGAGPHALRTDRRVAGGSLPAGGGIAARAQAAVHAGLSTARLGCCRLSSWDAPLGNYFEGVAKLSKHPKGVANWVINNLRAKLTESASSLEDLKFKAGGIPELVDLVENGKISTKIAQEVFADMFESGHSPGQIVKNKAPGAVIRRHRRD